MRLIYGGTGSTRLTEIAAHIASTGVNDITAAGMVLAIIGVCFKIAAVPMHFYTADVYQGASSPIAAFLAFTPKTAGFLALLLLAGTLGWSHAASGGDGAGNSLPEFARITLWVIAALTMTVGNALALVQTSVKRILAYSSIAHSGYMLVGVIAGPGHTFSSSGVAAVLFYLLCYGVMNVGAFAVLACLERAPASPDDDPAEADSIDDIRGLCRTRPMLGWVMVINAEPPGPAVHARVLGQAPLFTSGITAGESPWCHPRPQLRRCRVLLPPARRPPPARGAADSASTLATTPSGAAGSPHCSPPRASSPWSSSPTAPWSPATRPRLTRARATSPRTTRPPPPRTPPPASTLIRTDPALA